MSAENWIALGLTIFVIVTLIVVAKSGDWTIYTSETTTIERASDDEE